MKISELSSATTLSGTEVVPIVQSGVTKKITASSLASGSNSAVYYAPAPIGGGSDDTAALQAAVDEWLAGTAKIFQFQPGVYTILGTLTVTNMIGRIMQGTGYSAGYGSTQLVRPTNTNNSTMMAFPGMHTSILQNLGLQGDVNNLPVVLDIYSSAQYACQSCKLYNIFIKYANTAVQLGKNVGGNSQTSEMLLQDLFIYSVNTGIVTLNDNALNIRVIGGEIGGYATAGIKVTHGSINLIENVAFEGSGAPTAYDIDIQNASDTDICNVIACRTESDNFVRSAYSQVNIIGCAASHFCNAFAECANPGALYIEGCIAVNGYVNVPNFGATIVNCTFGLPAGEWLYTSYLGTSHDPSHGPYRVMVQNVRVGVTGSLWGTDAQITTYSNGYFDKWGDYHDLSLPATPLLPTSLGGSNLQAWYDVSSVANVTTTGGSSATVTMTAANPGVVSWTGHGLSAGSMVIFKGGVPSPVTAGQPYYVIATDLGANSFKFSATVGGSAVNTTNPAITFWAYTTGNGGGWVNWTGHAFANGTAVQFFGSPPAQISVGTTYYVVGQVTDWFQLATSVGGSAIVFPGGSTNGVQVGSGTGQYAGTITAYNPAQISQINDLSGNSKNLTQATASKRPLYLTTTNATIQTTLPVARFVSANSQEMGLTLTAVTGYTIIAVMCNITNNGQGMPAFGNSSDVNTGGCVIGPGVGQGWLYTTDATKQAYADNTYTPYMNYMSVFAVTSTGSNVWEFYKDGRLIDGALNGSSSQASTMSFDRVGHGLNTYGEGMLGELMLFNRVLLRWEIEAVSAYLAGKWGITVGK